ncbi:MAG: DUF6799 domain-containing protein [Chitinophagaceae bacterium]
MRKVIVAMVLILGLSISSQAQSGTKMKDGVMMMDNKAMLCTKTSCAPLTKTYTCKDGAQVAPDGTVTKQDGTTMKMANGSKIDKSGKVTMIPHGQKGHVCGPECKMMKNKMK